jgi:HlyD family secretion protein
MKTFFLFCCLLAASASGAFWWINNQPEPLPKFRTLAPNRGELLIAVSATGTVEPVEVVDVGAQIVGRVKEFGPDRGAEGKTIDYGSKVKQGDILSQIDDSTYLAERDKAQANLRLAKADLRRAQAQQTHAKGDFKRAESLRDTNAESDYDRALAASEMANAEVLVVGFETGGDQLRVHPDYRADRWHRD